MLFLINPDVFVPIDKHTCIPLTAIYSDKGNTNKILTSIKKGTYKYVDAARELSDCFPKCKPYEISLFCRLAAYYVDSRSLMVNARDGIKQLVGEDLVGEDFGQGF